MRDPNAGRWMVEIVTNGRCGTILYREGAHVASFGWEFGGGDVVAILFVGFAPKWGAEQPWASGRRREILERVVAEVIRQRARTCEAIFVEDRGHILLRPRETKAP